MVQSYSSTKEKRVVKVGDRIVGQIKDGKFVKTVIGSRHRLRCPPAWCISETIFRQEIEPSCREIVIRDVESGLAYRTSVENFRKHCFEIQRGSFERQLALTLNNHWQIIGGECHQLSLFGGEAE